MSGALPLLAPRPLAPSLTDFFACVRRYISPAALDNEVIAGNRLPHDPSEHLEYLVHGKFARSEDDANGVFGAWWVDLETLFAQCLDDEDLENSIKEFEDYQRDARREAMQALRRQRPPAAAEDGEDAPRAASVVY